MSEIIDFPATNRRAFLTRALAGAAGATIAAGTGNTAPPQEADNWRSLGNVVKTFGRADPVITLARKHSRLVAAINAPGQAGDVTDAENAAVYEIEDQIEATVPISAAGAVVLVRFLQYRMHAFSWDKRDDQIVDNLIAGLDRLGAS